MSIRGWVYVLSNVGMPNLVKIGYSTKDPSLRAEELEGTGLPYPFVVEYDVLVTDPRDVEQEVHRILSDSNERKEFFRVDLVTAIEAIRSVIQNLGKSPIAESGPVDVPCEQGVTVSAAPHQSRIVKCKSCGESNQATRRRFVCSRCKNLQEIPDWEEVESERAMASKRMFQGSKTLPEVSRSVQNSESLKSNLNPEAAWPFQTGRRP